MEEALLLRYLQSLRLNQIAEFRNDFLKSMRQGNSSSRCETILTLVDDHHIGLLGSDPEYARTIVDALSPAVWNVAFKGLYQHVTTLDPYAPAPVMASPPPSAEVPARKIFGLFKGKTKPQSPSSPSFVVPPPALPSDSLLDDRFLAPPSQALSITFMDRLLQRLSSEVFSDNYGVFDSLVAVHGSRPLSVFLMQHLVAIPVSLLRQSSLSSDFSQIVGQGAAGIETLRRLWVQVASLLVNLLGRVAVDDTDELQCVVDELQKASALVSAVVGRLVTVMTRDLPPFMQFASLQLMNVLIALVPETIIRATTPSASTSQALTTEIERVTVSFVVAMMPDGPFFEELCQLRVEVHDVIPPLTSPSRTGVLFALMLLAHCAPNRDFGSVENMSTHFSRCLDGIASTANSRVSMAIALREVIAPYISSPDTVNKVSLSIMDAIDIVRDKVPSLASALGRCPAERADEDLAAYLREAPVHAELGTDAADFEDMFDDEEEFCPDPEASSASSSTRRPPTGASPDAQATLFLHLFPLAEPSYVDDELIGHMSAVSLLASTPHDRVNERTTLEEACITHATTAILNMYDAWQTAIVASHSNNHFANTSNILTGFLAMLTNAIFADMLPLASEALADVYAHYLEDQVKQMLEINFLPVLLVRHTVLQLIRTGCERIRIFRVRPTLANIVDALLASSISLEGAERLQSLAVEVLPPAPVAPMPKTPTSRAGTVRRGTLSGTRSRASAPSPRSVTSIEPEELLKEYDDFFKDFRYYPVHVVEPAPRAVASATAAPATADASRRFLEQYRKDYPRSAQPLELFISPSDMVQSSLAALREVDAETLRHRLPRVYFMDGSGQQEGVDQGGLRRAWLEGLGSQLSMAGTMLGLLSGPPDGLYLHPLADLMPEAEDYFKLLGRLLAYCIINNDDGLRLPIGLSTSMYALLLGRPLRTDDHDKLHDNVLKRLRQSAEMLAKQEMSAEDLALSNAHNVELNEDMRQSLRTLSLKYEEGNGGTTDVFISNEMHLASSIQVDDKGYAVFEFTPDGANQSLQAMQICSYANNIIRYNFGHYSPRSISTLVNSFRSLIPLRWSTSLDPYSLAIAVEGTPTIDLADWKQYATHNARSEAAQRTVSLFWEIVDGMSNQERAQLLCFVTAQSRLPPGGFSCLTKPFSINVRSDVQITDEVEPRAPLPVAHSCYNQLEIVSFRTKDIFASKLHNAMHVTDFYIK